MPSRDQSSPRTRLVRALPAFRLHRALPRTIWFRPLHRERLDDVERFESLGVLPTVPASSTVVILGMKLSWVILNEYASRLDNIREDVPE